MDFYDYDDLYYNSDFLSILSVFLGVITIVILIGAAFSLLLYILRSIGVMSIAKNRGIQRPWLVWIPIVGSFTVGAIADDIETREGGGGIYRFLMLGGSILTFLLSGASNIRYIATLMSDPYDVEALMAGGGFLSIGGLVSLAYYIITVIALHRIYKCYRPQSATAWTVWSAIPFTAFMQSIFPFVLRNSAPASQNPYGGGYGGYSPQGGYPPQDGYPPQGGYQPPPYDDQNR